jgi:hypothetical protein
MVGCTAQLTGVESGTHICKLLFNLSAADRREDAVLHMLMEGKSDGGLHMLHKFVELATQRADLPSKCIYKPHRFSDPVVFLKNHDGQS